MAVGQRLGRNSVIESWQDLNQSLRGIGIAAAVISLMTIFYYNYIVAWCLYYFVHSMRRTLLWSTCLTISNGNDTVDPECTKSSPAEYYWYRETLDVADDINKSTGEWRGKQLFDLYSRKGNGFKCTKQQVFFYNLKSFHVKSNSEIPFYNFQLTILFFRNQSVLILVCRGVLDVVISTDNARFSCSFKGW